MADPQTLLGTSAESIAAAVGVLAHNGLVGMPTETVYGLAADACSDVGVASVFSAKARPVDHPLIVHVAGADGVNHFAARVPGFAQRLIDAFWPGPLTLILPRRAGVATAAAAGQDSVGLRCPSHPVAQALLRACERQGMVGLAAPSANRFGRISPTTAAHVRSELGANLLILDGGPCTVGIESTIVDCTRSAPVVLRPGMLSLAQLETACACPVFTPATLEQSDARTPRVPGSLESHYAPLATLRLLDAQAIQTAIDSLFAQAPTALPEVAAASALYSRTLPCRVPLGLHQRRMPQDAASAARELFAVLRELDGIGVQQIWVEAPPASPEWDGVRDRLQRACTS